MNLSAVSWLGIHASWTHKHRWVSAFPCHMHMHVHGEWPMVWEHGHLSMFVCPGCTNSQPRHCTQIHDTVWCLHAISTNVVVNVGTVYEDELSSYVPGASTVTKVSCCDRARPWHI